MMKLINNMKAPIIVAHRGMPNYERENTLASFKRAIEIKAEMIEFDVRRSSDGILLVHHDPYVQRGSEKHFICDNSYDCLKLLADYSIPTLEQVLSLCCGEINLDVELKETGYEAEILDYVTRYCDVGTFIITSFHDSAIKAIGEINPEVTTGLLMEEMNNWEMISCRLKNCGSKYWLPYYKIVTEDLMKAAQQNNITVYVWTINETEEMIQLVNMGVTGLITNVADVALKMKRNYF